MAEKKQNTAKLWERQPKETPKQFEAFAIYRDMDAGDRSLAKVGQQLGKSKQLIERWSSANNWVERVAAYEAEIDRQTAREQIKDIAKMRARQRKQALKMQGKALELMKSIREGDAKLSEIVSLMKLGMEQERIVMGDVGEVVEERDGGQAASAVQFYMPSNGRDDENPDEKDE